MGFHINTTGYIEGRAGAPQKAQGGCYCGCDGRGPDPSEGGALVQAMQALMLNARIDKALERAAPLHAQAKGDAPLTPRGVLSGKPKTATEQAPAPRRHRTRWGEIVQAKATKSKPSTNAPLVPRGIMGGK